MPRPSNACSLAPLQALFVLAVGLLGGVQTAQAETLRLATWNLGWHVSQAELPAWRAQCDRVYAKDAASGVWQPVADGTPGATRGWDITESRAKVQGIDLSVMPPCAVYQGPGRQGIEVTPGAWARRNAALARMLGEVVRPDVIAFQEVSGTQAVREALGPVADQYQVCSFDGRYKVQRLAFAWLKRWGEGACTELPALALLHLPPSQQVRPGLALRLLIKGQSVNLLTLHLKSGCVSPLDRGRLDGNSGPDDPCPVLQQQVAPLEAAIKTLSQSADHLVVLGDFNRNLWHEFNQVAGAEPVRSDGGTDLAAPLPAGVRSRNLLREVNDGVPARSSLVLLAPQCSVDPALQALCDAAKTGVLNGSQRNTLGHRQGLGCRNAVGLDQVLVSKGLAAAVRRLDKLPLGSHGQSLPAKPPVYPDAQLGLSDHCPAVLELDL